MDRTVIVDPRWRFGSDLEPPDSGAGERVNTFVDRLQAAAMQSTCSRGANAAMLVGPGLTFTNGPLATDPPCDHVEGVRCRNAVHAEMRLVTWAARTGHALTGASVACTTAPCYRCAQLLVDAGVAEVAYLAEFREPEGLQILRRAGVEVWRIGDPHA